MAALLNERVCEGSVLACATILSLAMIIAVRRTHHGLAALSVVGLCCSFSGWVLFRNLGTDYYSLLWFGLPGILLAVLVAHLDARGKEYWAQRICLGSLAIVVVVILWRVVHVGFGMTDDHEYAYLQGNSGGLSFSDALRIYPLLEPGQFGMTFRYRPVYYVLRMAETLAFRDSAPLYLLLRVFFALLFSIGTFHLGRVWLPRWYALCGAVLVFALPAWTQIWLDLGAAEVYGITALPWIVLFSIRSLNEDRPHLATAYVYASGGLATLAIGSKENFVFMPALYAISLAISLCAGRRVRTTAHHLIVLLVTGTAAAFILAAIAPMMASTDVDQIGRPAGISSKIAVVRYFLGTFYGALILAIAIGSVVAPLVARYHSSHLDKTSANAIWGLSQFVLFSCVIIFSQQAAYSGDLPTALRYNFPYALGAFYLAAIALPAVGLFAAKPVGNSTDLPESPHYPHRCRKNSSGYLLIPPALLGALLAGSADWGAFERGISTRRLANFSNTTTIQSASRMAKANPSAPVVVVLDEIGAYEGAVAAEKYLRQAGVGNDIYLAASSKCQSGTPSEWGSLQKKFYFKSLPIPVPATEKQIIREFDDNGVVLLRLHEHMAFTIPSRLFWVTDIIGGAGVSTWPRVGDSFMVDQKRPITLHYNAHGPSDNVNAWYVFFEVIYPGGGHKLRLALLDSEGTEIGQVTGGTIEKFDVPTRPYPQTLYNTSRTMFGFAVPLTSLIQGNALRIEPDENDMVLHVGPARLIYSPQAILIQPLE